MAARFAAVVAKAEHLDPPAPRSMRRPGRSRRSDYVKHVVTARTDRPSADKISPDGSPRRGAWRGARVWVDTVGIDRRASERTWSTSWELSGWTPRHGC